MVQLKANKKAISSVKEIEKRIALFEKTLAQIEITKALIQVQRDRYFSIENQVRRALKGL